MRRLTPSGSAATSIPSTMAVPDEGRNNPQSIRIVVDFPAPLLPRNPKISPFLTSNDTSSTATNAPNRRVRCLTSIAIDTLSFPFSLFPCPLLPDRPIEPRLGEPRVGARTGQVEFRLKDGDVRVDHVGARHDAGAKPLHHDPAGFRGAAHP